MLASRCPVALPFRSRFRPLRGTVPLHRICLQVDAIMRSWSHTANPQPKGRVAAVALAQNLPPRLRIMADTFRGAPEHSFGGAYPFSVCARGGIHTDRRVPAYVPAFPGQSMAAARAWRLLHGNAHADRCAPPGRNAGGGAQGQPD